jgi:HEAT repeat protein
MQPYKGLQPYTEQDKDNFFGRESEKRILIDKILTHKLTFLFAASGVGKSSLLQAAVLPELKNPTRPDRAPLDVIYYKDWVDNPLNTLKKEIIADLKAKGQLPQDDTLDLNESLKDFFHFCTAFTSDPLVVILDQFEEFFNYQRFSAYYQPVISELAAAIHDRETETVFVISMREDFALELNAFQDVLPTFLIDNFYRLEKLTLEKARMAVVEPVAKLGFQYEPALLKQLLEDLLLREQRERGLKDIIADHKLPPLIEPPHLQMICMQLWDLARDNPEKQITQTVFDKKGGTEGLLARYFLDKMQHLSGKEKPLASKAFDFLVNRHGTKMPRSLPDLANLIRVEQGVLDETLDKLERGRILRRQLRYGTATQKGILWYELHHDFFSQPIYQWNEAFKTRQRIKKGSLGTGAVVVASAMSFVAWDTWVNYSTYHLRLSIKSGLSDGVEVYRGEAGSYDFFNQQGFVRETVYERNEIEADKLFVERPVVEFEQLNAEVVGRLPLADRIEAYLDNGDLDKALGLARCAISDKDMHLSEKVILNLVSFRSVETYNLLGGILQTVQNNNSRKKIVEVFAQSKAPKHVVPFLIAVTEDEINEIRQKAAESLGELGAKETIEALIALLKDQNLSVREQATKSLSQLKAKKAIEPLIVLLKDQNSSVRKQAAKSLGQLKAKKAIEPLIALLNDPNSSVRRQATESLGQLGAEKSIEALIVLLNDQDSDVRKQAAKSLGKLRAKKAIEALMALLNDPDLSVRAQAAESLGELGSKKVIEALIALLNDINPLVRAQAVELLGKLGNKNATEALIYLVNDPDSYVRQKTIFSLAQLGSKKAIEPLMALLNDPDSSVQQNAILLLGRLGSEKSIEPLITLLKDHQAWYLQITATKILYQLGSEKELGSEKVIQALIPLLNNQDSNVRRQIINLLGQLGSKKAIKPLIALLNDKNSSVQMQIIESLAQLGSKKAIKPLIALLNDKNSSVQMQTVKSLAQLGAKQTIEPLITLLNDKNSVVLINQVNFLLIETVKSLAKLEGKQAIEALIPLLKKQEVRMQAKQDKNMALYLQKRYAYNILKTIKTSLELLNNSETLSKKSEQSISQAFKQDIQQLFDSVELLNNSETLSKKSEQSISPASKQDIQQLLASLEDDNIHTQKEAIESLGKIAANAPEDFQAKILEKLTAIASNEQALFGTRIKALENLGKLGTEAATNNIIQIAQQAQGEFRDSYVFTAYQALQDTKTPIALDFLQNELDTLTRQKQQWRKRRDQEEGDGVASTTEPCKVSPQLDNDKRWQYGYWETELGYAIAQHDPAKAGLEMLKHPLANVRQGAWFGIAKIGVPTVEILQKINQERDRSTAPHFRHAAFRALDKSLITIEVYGTEQDVQALKNWLPDVTDFAVKDRIAFTLAELEYRIEQAQGSEE